MTSKSGEPFGPNEGLSDTDIESIQTAYSCPLVSPNRSNFVPPFVPQCEVRSLPPLEGVTGCLISISGCGADTIEVAMAGCASTQTFTGEDGVHLVPNCATCSSAFIVCSDACPTGLLCRTGQCVVDPAVRPTVFSCPPDSNGFPEIAPGQTASIPCTSGTAVSYTVHVVALTLLIANTTNTII
jgi:hypothetical protein